MYINNKKCNKKKQKNLLALKMLLLLRVTFHLKLTNSTKRTEFNLLRISVKVFSENKEVFKNEKKDRTKLIKRLHNNKINLAIRARTNR